MSAWSNLLERISRSSVKTVKQRFHKLMTDAPKTWTNTQQVIAFALVGSFIAVIFVWMLFPPRGVDQSVLTVVNMLIGALVAKFTTIVDFFFGSSQGSKDKDEAQNKIVESLTGTGAGNTAAATTAAAVAAAPLAAAAAAPPAAAVAAPPAAEAAAPAAAEKAVAEAMHLNK